MNAIKHPLCNSSLGPPPGVPEEVCRTLHIRREGLSVTSYWLPSRTELAVLNSGGAIAFRADSPTHPPISMSVALPERAIPDQAIVQACLRRMVQLMWSPSYASESVQTIRSLLVGDFEPEVIQQAFGAVGFGRETAENVTVPFIPEDEEAGTPFWIMDKISAFSFYGMGMAPTPDVEAVESYSLSELVDAMHKADAQRADFRAKGQIRVLPDERLVSAVHAFCRFKLRPQDGDQEIVVHDGDQALVIVRLAKPPEAK